MSSIHSRFLLASRPNPTRGSRYWTFVGLISYPPWKCEINHFQTMIYRTNAPTEQSYNRRKLIPAGM